MNAVCWLRASQSTPAFSQACLSGDTTQQHPASRNNCPICGRRMRPPGANLTLWFMTANTAHQPAYVCADVSKQLQHVHAAVLLVLITISQRMLSGLSQPWQPLVGRSFRGCQRVHSGRQEHASLASCAVVRHHNATQAERCIKDNMKLFPGNAAIDKNSISVISACAGHAGESRSCCQLRSLQCSMVLHATHELHE